MAVWLVSVYGCWAKKSPKNGLDQASAEDFVCLPTLLRLATTRPVNIVSPKASRTTIFIYALKSAKIPSLYVFCKNIFIHTILGGISIFFSIKSDNVQRDHF